MKLERFFEKFDQFADAPNAVAKMRELLLGLAVQGKLVDQNPSDEPAPELLKKIYAEKSGRLSRSESIGGDLAVVGEDYPFSIPTSWQWVGATTPALMISDLGKKVQTKDVLEKGTYPVVDQGKVFVRGYCNDPEKVIRLTGPIVLFGDHTRETKLIDFDFVVGADGVKLLQPLHIDPAYYFLALRWLPLDSRGYGRHFKLLRAAVIPLPPLAEQKRIVAKVDELMVLCDRLEAQQQERDTRHAALVRASLARFAEAPTPANLDFLFHPSYTITPADLRKSILTLAVQGKLVPQNPNDEPVDQLLENIAKQRAKLISADSLRKSKNCRQFSSDEAPHEIPDTWAWTMLGEITDVGTGSTPSRTETSFWMNGSIPWITSGSTSTSPIIEGDEFVTESAVKAHRLRIYQPGTLLVAMYGQGKTRGQVALLEISATINQACAAISALEGIAPMQGYLKLLLEKQYDEMRLLSAGGAQPNLNVQKIKEVFVPLPPLAEQRRIVAKVDQLMALVDQLESQLAVAKSKSAALFEAVVHELLHPTAEVIDLASYRAAIGCYTIRKMSQQPYFGRTAAMKMFYLGEAHVGLNLRFQPEREAAGPLDHWIYRFEEEGKQKEWFKAVENASNGKMKVEYQPGKMLAAQAALAESQLAQEQRNEFDRLLDLLSDKKTEEVEIIATLFAAWNDFLLDGHVPSDDEIVTEVRENWHAKKERFTPAQLRQWLGWLRQNNLVPQGRAPRTVHQPQLLLN